MKNIKQNFLGVVWPVDGIGNPDYELLRLDRWFTKRGLGQVTVRLDYSQAGVSHTHDELFKTGSLEALLPPAKRLAEEGASSSVWACTSGSSIGGLDWAKRQVNVLKDATGLPTISTTLALIEAVTYRLGDHTTADDARRYRDPEELELWKKRDPMIRLRQYLEQNDLWSAAKEEEQLAFAANEISRVVKNAEEIDAPSSTDMFDSMYGELSPELLKQRQTMRTSSLGQDPSQVDVASEKGVVK